jgi:hypothetical protein
VNDRRIWLRVIGTLVLAVTLVIFDSTAPGVWQSLGLPLLLALGAWALVQNLAAVALGAAVLAAIHSDLNAVSWVDRVAYPSIALVSGCILLAISVRRFRARISSTRAARWAQRQSASGSSEQADPSVHP